VGAWFFRSAEKPELSIFFRLVAVVNRGQNLPWNARTHFFSKIFYGERQGYSENDYLQPVGGCDTDVGRTCFRPSPKRLLREAAHD
jgi:hypothetical protein